MIYKEFIADSCLSRNGISVKREAVRGIVYQEDKFLMLYSQINKDFSFPGGGIESGESKHDALKREMLEECGAEILTIEPPIAEIIEIDPAIGPDISLFIRNTHYFPCRISDQFVEPYLSASEMLRENTIVWVSLEEALYNNQMLIRNTNSSPPRWSRRETYILEQLAQHTELCRGNHLD